jgi:hypothetical protein
VKALQQALNKIPNWFPRIVDFELAEDGVLGERRPNSHDGFTFSAGG